MKKKIRTFFRVRRLYYSRLKLRQAANQHLVTGFFFQSLMADPMGCSGGPSEAHRRFCGGGGGVTLLAHNFEFHEKNSTVIAGRLRRLLLVWRTRRPQTPHKERASISLAVVAYGEFFAVRKSSAKTVSWGRLGFVLFCVLRISRTNFDHSSNHTVEMGVSLETSVAGSLESTTSCCELTPS